MLTPVKTYLQKVQYAIAGFVLHTYTKIKVVLEFKWLMIEERINFSTFIFIVQSVTWPAFFKAFTSTTKGNQ